MQGLIIHETNLQVWILYFLECPYHTGHVKYNDLVNWTATYRRDSDVVAPYEKWVYHDRSVTEYPGPLRDFTANKTDKVAWFVSNCGARNGRLQYAQELQKYIQVCLLMYTNFWAFCANYITRDKLITTYCRTGRRK